MRPTGEVMVAQLHEWDAHDHAHIGNAAIESRGNGELLWFLFDDFDALMQRVSGNDIVVLDGLMLHPQLRTARGLDARARGLRHGRGRTRRPI